MTLLVPSSLLPQAGDNKDSNRFVLASSEWLDLQTRIESVLALPSDIGEYEERYGDASSGSQMRACFDAMHALQQTAGGYGSPRSLRSAVLNDPNFLAGRARPRNDAFSSTVWTMQKAHQDAFTLASAFNSIPSLAAQETASGTVAGIKSLFLDGGQIVSNLDQTIAQLDALITEFQSLERQLDNAQQAMKVYTDRSSKTRIALDKEIGALQATIADLEQKRDAAYSKWLDLTIAACVAPAVIGVVGIAIMVILAVPTGGASFAVGSAITGGAATIAAGALGVAAGIARSQYDSLVEKVEQQDEFMQKRVCYRSDLGALDKLMQFSLPASGGVITQLGAVREAWAGARGEIVARVNDLSTANLGDSPWLKRDQMAAASAGWTRLDEALKAFMRGSFVDAVVLDFGDPLPQDQARWSQSFAIAKAA